MTQQEGSFTPPSHTHFLFFSKSSGLWAVGPLRKLHCFWGRAMTITGCVPVCARLERKWSVGTQLVKEGGRKMDG